MDTGSSGIVRPSRCLSDNRRYDLYEVANLEGQIQNAGGDGLGEKVDEWRQTRNLTERWLSDDRSDTGPRPRGLAKHIAEVGKQRTRNVWFRPGECLRLIYDGLCG